MNSIKQLILCADDFGQNGYICDGILQLATLERLNSISCLVNMPMWYERSSELLKLPSSCQIGLHLNFTLGQALSAGWRKKVGDEFRGLPYLIRQSYFRRLTYKILMSEIESQLNVFIDTLGRYPDFIDGHQHVHQLPMVRQALLQIYQQEKLACYLRHTYNGVRDLFVRVNPTKVQAISLLGGRAFSSLLNKNSIQTHTSFAGVYAFTKSHNSRKYFNYFLDKSQSLGLIMCHPGLRSNDHSDPLYKSREHEFNYFMSDDFLQDLQKNSAILVRDLF